MNALRPESLTQVNDPQCPNEGPLRLSTATSASQTAPWAGDGGMVAPKLVWDSFASWPGTMWNTLANSGSDWFSREFQPDRKTQATCGCSAWLHEHKEAHVVFAVIYSKGGLVPVAQVACVLCKHNRAWNSTASRRFFCR